MFYDIPRQVHDYRGTLCQIVIKIAQHISGIVIKGCCKVNCKKTLTRQSVMEKVCYIFICFHFCINYKTLMALDRMHIDIGEGSEGMLSSTVRQTRLKVWTRSDGSGAKPARARGYFTSLLTRGFCQLAGNVRLPSNCCAHFFEETWRHPCFPNEAALEEKKCKWLNVISHTISFFF